MNDFTDYVECALDPVGAADRIRALIAERDAAVRLYNAEAETAHAEMDRAEKAEAEVARLLALHRSDTALIMQYQTERYETFRERDEARASLRQRDTLFASYIEHEMALEAEVERLRGLLGDVRAGVERVAQMTDVECDFDGFGARDRARQILSRIDAGPATEDTP